MVRRKTTAQHSAWQYGGATSIFSAFSLIGFSLGRRITPDNRINNELLFINLAAVISRRNANSQPAQSPVRYLQCSGRHLKFMEIPVLDSQTSLQILFHKLTAGNGEVTIVKNKAILNRKVFIMIVLIAIISYISWTVLVQSPDAFKKPLDVNGILLVSIACLLIIVNLYLSTKRLVRGLSNFNIKKRNCLYINNKPVAKLNADQKETIVMQAVPGSKGIGTNYTVGVAAGKKFWGLCYDLDDVDANKVAIFLSRHLGLAVERKESALFPLFKLH